MILGYLGRHVTRDLVYVLDLSVFTYRAVSGMFRQGWLQDKATRVSALHQVIFSGIDAIPIVFVFALLIGLSVSSQFFLTLDVLDENKEVMQLLLRLMTLELGALLSAFIVIGRSGAAITVDLGHMSVNREIDGLVLLGIDIHHFFIFPRLVGLAVSQLVLAVLFSAICMLSGMVFSAYLEATSVMKYLVLLPDSFTSLDVVLFVLKNLFFGLVIGAIACFHGLRVGVSATEVPQATQRAIINAMLIIFFLDGLFVILAQSI